MARVLRFDAGSLSAPVKTPQGFLRVEGWASRAGIYEYTNTPEDEKLGFGKAGTIRRELRTDAEAFSDAVMSGYEGASMAVFHPKKMIDIMNNRTYEVGTVTQARRDGERVALTMVIKDAKAIADIEAKKLTQLSPGYMADIEKKPGADARYAYPGNPEGRYDCVQENVQINHVALCRRARGGDAMQLRLDGDITAAEERTDDGMMMAGPMDADEAPELVVMTTSVDGHQHTLDPSDPSGCTSRALSEGAQDSHMHEWIRAADGTITIGENAGHTHGIDNTTIGLREDALDRADDLTAEMRKNMGAHEFAVPSTRALPIHDAAHVRAAMSRFGQTEFPDAGAKKTAFNKIKSAAAKFNIDSSGFEKAWSTRLDSLSAQGGRMSDTTMKPEEQVALLNAKLSELEQAKTQAENEVKVQRARADSAEQLARTEAERVAERDAKIAAGQVDAETKALRKLQARVDELEQELATAKTAAIEYARKRGEIASKAKALFGPTYRTDSLTDQALQEAIIRKLRPNEDLGALKSDEARQARCDALFDDRVATARSIDMDRERTVTTQRQERRDTHDAPSLSHRDQWKDGLPGTQARSRRKEA